VAQAVHGYPGTPLGPSAIGRKKGRITHYYLAEQRRILCGIKDPAANWTTRTGVTCPRCRELLRRLR
jgi:hypothetical protein